MRVCEPCAAEHFRRDIDYDGCVRCTNRKQFACPKTAMTLPHAAAGYFVEPVTTVVANVTKVDVEITMQLEKL
eukprot:COSAG01_NODE_56570_length_317_cov_1.183486_1_plen_72_part_01